MQFRFGVLAILLLGCGSAGTDSDRCTDKKEIEKCPCPGVNDIKYGERRCHQDGSYGPCLGCPSPDGRVNAAGASGAGNNVNDQRSDGQGRSRDSEKMPGSERSDGDSSSNTDGTSGGRVATGLAVMGGHALGNGSGGDGGGQAAP